jgi:hypothetical protein
MIGEGEHVHARRGAECGWVEGLRLEREKSNYIDNQGLKKLKHRWSTPQATFQGKRKRHDLRVEAYFEIAELRKLLAAVIETTEVRLGLIVDDLVGADIPALRESLPADLAMVWTFSSVPSFVRLEFSVSRDRAGESGFCIYLQISKLGEAATTSRFFAWLE